jgi:hypothetical protein
VEDAAFADQAKGEDGGGEQSDERKQESWPRHGFASLEWASVGRGRPRPVAGGSQRETGSKRSRVGVTERIRANR